MADIREKLALLGTLQGLESGDIRNRLSSQQFEQKEELFPEELLGLQSRRLNAADQLAIQQSIEERSAGREPLVRQGLESRIAGETQQLGQREVTNPLVAEQLREAIKAQIASTARGEIVDPLQAEALQLANERANIQNVFDIASAGGFPRTLEGLSQRGVEGTELQQRLTQEQLRSVVSKIVDGQLDDPEVLQAAQLDASVRELLQRAQGGQN